MDNAVNSRKTAEEIEVISCVLNRNKFVYMQTLKDLAENIEKLVEEVLTSIKQDRGNW